MEFNKNKIIFLIIGGLIVLSIIFLLVTISNKPTSDNWSKLSWDIFKIWLVWDSVTDSNTFIEWFKKVYPNFKNKQIIIESFDSYEDYTYTLMSSISSWNWPDVFVLNNNEKSSVFSNQVLWIEPNIVNPNDFRKKYKWVFSDDLISSYSVEWQTKEYVMGLPVWYETLWVYYNRRYIKDSDLKNLSSLNNVVSELKSKYPEVIPIWIGNWSTVYNSADIISQFFMLEWGVSWLWNVNSKVASQSLPSYLLYWDVTGFNWYNKRFQELKDTNKTSINLFSTWEAFMIIWYPSMLKKIKEIWFSKNMLQATHFPHYFSWAWKTLINYNYFVINKDTSNLDLANTLISYLYSDSWASSYLNSYTYYLPALLSLEAEKLSSKIDKDYSIILWDFYNEETELSSFDKWIKVIYDKNISLLLDKESFDNESFNSFKESIMCKANKISTFTNLSVNCDR